MSRNIAVVGSRRFPQPAWTVAWFLDSLPLDVHIISGGAPGIDQAAENWCRTKRHHEPTVIRADWQNREKAAGKERNIEIVRRADEVIAFWDGTSSGTAHSIALAVRFGKPVTIHMPGDS